MTIYTRLQAGRRCHVDVRATLLREPLETKTSRAATLLRAPLVISKTKTKPSFYFKIFWDYLIIIITLYLFIYLFGNNHIIIILAKIGYLDLPRPDFQPDFRPDFIVCPRPKPTDERPATLLASCLLGTATTYVS